MKFLFLNHIQAYNGSQLSPLWNYLNHGLLGDSVVSFLGPCDVKNEFMKDGEDLKQNALIKSDMMLHFIFEVFHVELPTGVLIQRIFASLVQNELLKNLKVNREGDDLYFDNRKLSISIATSSRNSVLIHFAMNWFETGAPVPIATLPELCQLSDSEIKLESNQAPKTAEIISVQLMNLISREWLSVKDATCKVICF
jgi:hypothetical protein